MQLKEFDILLDIKKRSKPDLFEVVQGDSHSNILNISLFDGLVPFNLTGTTAEIVFKKSDGTTVMQSDIILVDEVQGKVQCTLRTNTIASHGKVVAEIRLMENDVLLTSTTFEFYVRKALLNDETIESTNEFPILTRLINEVRQIEAQVPEEVVGSLNTLESYVNGLAGSGRANETIKGNADNILQLIGYVGNLENLDTVEKTNIVSALNEIYQNHTTHLAENANKAHGGFKGAMVRKNANQSIPGGEVNTPLSWQTVAYDTSNIHNSNNPTRLTVPSGVSKVRVAFQIAINDVGGATNRVGLLIQKNGRLDFNGRATINAVPAGGSSATFNLVSPVLPVVAGDYFETLIFHGASGSLEVSDWWTTWASLEVVE